MVKGNKAHFQADADLRGKWARQGEPALVEATSPRRGEQVSCYSAVCLETGEVVVMELEATATPGPLPTSCGNCGVNIPNR